jgi:hypothetical protein
LTTDAAVLLLTAAELGAADEEKLGWGVLSSDGDELAVPCVLDPPWMVDDAGVV